VAPSAFCIAIRPTKVGISESKAMCWSASKANRAFGLGPS
jgi:hypothetical protein